jgi:transcription antitermination factor NusG
VRQWSDRKKTIFEPLFRSYVFVHITDRELSYVKEVSGVISFVSFLGRPAVIRDCEIEIIRQFINDYENIHVEPMNFEVNDKVKVLGGPFRDMGGNVVEIKNKTIRVLLPSFSYILSAEFKKSNLEKDSLKSSADSFHSS